MSRYLTPLPGLLAGALEAVLNRAAALDDDAADSLQALDGRWLKLVLEGLGIDLWIGIEGRRFKVLAEAGHEPDTVISGTPVALAAMLFPEADASGVRIEGDARVAQQFQTLLKRLDPDVEQALSERFGPLLGVQMYRVYTEVTGFARQAAEVGREQLVGWLRDESALVPTPREWREFREGVDELREAVDRLERRIRVRRA
ncbi:MAG: SCP2 sterol-binding domain-containing protein [Wenzhouxiangellaceae bacterium]